MASAAAGADGLPLLDGGVPLLGHLAQFFRNPVSVLKRGYRSKGRLFAMNFMGQRMNVMLGPEHNRFFFEETDKLLSIRESMPFFLKMFSPEFYSFAEMDEYLRQRDAEPSHAATLRRGHHGPARWTNRTRGATWS